MLAPGGISCKYWGQFPGEMDSHPTSGRVHFINEFFFANLSLISVYAIQGFGYSEIMINIPSLGLACCKAMANQ